MSSRGVWFRKWESLLAKRLSSRVGDSCSHIETNRNPSVFPLVFDTSNAEQQYRGGRANLTEPHAESLVPKEKMPETLNPRLDVVFKMLFAAKRNRGLLIVLLNVLYSAQPIASVDVVNPEIEKDAPDDRGVILDTLVVHDDGSLSNIEMQAQDRGATEKRALYHWARMYRDGVGRGDDFADLEPCRVIFFLTYRLLLGERLRSTFRVLRSA